MTLVLQVRLDAEAGDGRAEMQGATEDLRRLDQAGKGASQGLGQAGNAAERAERWLRQTGAAAERGGRSLRETAAGAERADQELRGAAEALRQAATALMTTSSNAERAGGTLRRTGDQAAQASRQVAGLRDMTRQLGGMLATLGIGYGMAQFVRGTLDATMAMQSLESRLERMTGSSERAAQEQAWLQETAKRLSTDLVVLGDNWARLLILVNSGVIGLEQGRKLLEGFADVAAATGAGPQQIGQAMYGLAQGLSSGVLRAEEFNQATEPLVGLVNALDRAFVEVTGSTEEVAGAMRRAVNEGKVTSELFGRLLVVALEDYAGAAEEMAGNLQQQLTRVKNEWTLLLAALSSPATGGTGFFDGIADALTFLRENIELTRIAALGLGTALTVGLAGPAIINGVRMLGAALATLLTPLGPLGAMLTVIGGAVALFGGVEEEARGAAEAIEAYKRALGMQQDAADAAEGTNEDLAQSMQTAADVAWELARALGSIALNRVNEEIGELEREVRQVEALIRLKDSGSRVSGLGLSKSAGEARLDDLRKEIADLTAQRDLLLDPASITLPAREEGGGRPRRTGGGEGSDKLRDLLDRLDPVGAALRALAEDQALLTAAWQAGQLTAGDYSVWMERLKLSYREALDPLGVLLEQYREEAGLLALSAEERAIQQEMLKAEQALRAKGIELGAEELQQLRRAIEERRREQAASNSRQRAGSLSDELTLIQAEIRLQGLASDEREVAIALLERELQLKREGLDLTSATAQAELDLLEKTIRGRQELESLKSWHEELGRVGERAFDRIGEAITQAFADGSMEALDFGQIAKAVLSELLQEMFRIAILNPLKQAWGQVLSGIGNWFSPSSPAATTGSVTISGTAKPITNFQGTLIPTAHRGGIAGQIAGSRSVDMSVFDQARRYHRGGLLPGEVPIIAEEGEEVLTRDDPRHQRNGGGRPSVMVVIHNNVEGAQARTREKWNGDQLELEVLVDRIDEYLAGKEARGDSKFGNTHASRYGQDRGRGLLR